MSALALSSTDPSLITSEMQWTAPPLPTVPTKYALGRNPMLPQHPLGAFTDSQYEADEAMLRNQVIKQYADLLQQLGYRDEAGNFIMGSLEANANKKNEELLRQEQLAWEDVTRQAQNEGTLFSGRRATRTAQAQEPFVRERADLVASLPLQFQQLYEQGAGLANDYVLGQNQMLAEAARRRAEDLWKQDLLNLLKSGTGAGGGGSPSPPAPGAPVAAPNVALPGWSTTPSVPMGAERSGGSPTAPSQFYPSRIQNYGI